jgi:hypothetical protein
MREWLIYVVLAGAAITIYYLAKGKSLQVGVFAGLLISGPMYLVVGGVLAKFGIQRKTMKEMRAERPALMAEREARRGRRGGTQQQASVRARPAPTRRTSTGPSNRPKPKRR